MKKKKVLVGMSGGVDSSVTAFLLKKEGYEVIGIHFELWKDEESEGVHNSRKKLPSEPITPDEVAQRLEIPFFRFDFRERFKREVVQGFLDEFPLGFTPNPCVECNRKIKFGYFLEKMNDMDAHFVATGHYARNVWNEERRAWSLFNGIDPLKDQSYFLYTLTQEKLKHILFPLGVYHKSEIRKIAEDSGFPELNAKSESQEICFIPGNDYVPFLKRNLGKEMFQKGEIHRAATGEKIGMHEGLAGYTIGQRARISGSKIPLYVIRMEASTNTLFVGGDEELFSDRVVFRNATWISEEPSLGDPVEVKIRHGGKVQKAIIAEKGGTWMLSLETPARAVTPGQSAVLSRGGEILGGGIII